MRFMSGLLQVVFFLAVVWASLLAAGLISNDLPWSDSPGMGTRLLTYLSTNVAETTPDTAFPELRPRTYAAPAALMFDVARRAAEALHWELSTVEPEERKIEAVVTTRVIKFKDDVTIWVEADGEERSTLFARSASRVGKSDLGANTRHLMNLFETVDIIAPVTAIVDKEEVTEEAQTSPEAMPTKSATPPATEDPSRE
ncbi:MAG: DUF1499 domain-containing protein [Desulfurellaceae bacterium]|nr:DUF1499 domain-containing protein [Desulfurellaceae bacterium]